MITTMKGLKSKLTYWEPVPSKFIVLWVWILKPVSFDKGAPMRSNSFSMSYLFYLLLRSAAAGESALAPVLDLPAKPWSSILTKEGLVKMLYGGEVVLISVFLV